MERTDAQWGCVEVEARELGSEVFLMTWRWVDSNTGEDMVEQVFFPEHLVPALLAELERTDYDVRP